MELNNENDQREKRIKLLVTAGIFTAGLLISALLWLWNLAAAGKEAGSDALAVVVEAEGTVYAAVPLTEDAEIPVFTKEGQNLVKIEGGSVCVAEADCPNQICVHTKPIFREGETIVCLPHRVVVSIQRR